MYYCMYTIISVNEWQLGDFIDQRYKKKIKIFYFKHFKFKYWDLLQLFYIF